MVDLGLKSYSEFYLKNAQDEVGVLKGLLAEGKNLVELHRVSHSLKGQSYFMNFNEVGDKAKDLEFFFKGLLDKSQAELGQNDYPKNVLAEIETLLLKLKI